MISAQNSFKYYQNYSILDPSSINFKWNNDIPYIIDSNNKEYLLEIDQNISNKTIPNESRNILFIGDSYDLRACGNIMGGTPLSPKREIITKTNIYVICDDKILNIKYYYARFFGFKPSKSSWYLTDGDYIEFIKYRVDYLNSKNISLDGIIFTSFLWDLRNSHDDYCHNNYNRLINDSYYIESCKYTIRFQNKSINTMSIQDYNSISTPWCGSTFLEDWKYNLTSVVIELKVYIYIYI